MGYEGRRQPGYEPEHEPADQGAPSRQAGSPAPGPVPRGDLIGQTLDGRYRFDALVGEGSFARVYQVFDTNRRVTLAAKVLRQDIAHEPAFLARFRREAVVLARLQHPHIVRYYDIVEAGETVFILTDYIPGETLQTRLYRQAGPLSPLDALAILQPLAAALHFAHSEGVIHRDLKPANILIDPNEQVYVTDFGIARIVSEASTLTVDAAVGTPHYMSPEQILAAEVTPATDIYALGVMLYQMLTGRLPFVGESEGVQGSTTAVRIVYEHLHVAPTPPREVNPRLSATVEDVILRCLEKDPAQRYQTVSALYDALTAAIGTPSVSLDRGAIPAQEDPVPMPAQEAFAGGDEPLAEAESWGDVAGEPVPDWVPKANRKPKPAAEDARRPDEKESEKKEKETEKERDSEEKEDEKETEKGEEKGEFWGEIAPSDQLSQVTWAGIVLWAGTVLLLNNLGVGGELFAQTWSWILAGAGGLLVGEVGLRIALPEFRTRPGARLVLGVVLLMLGVGTGLGLSVSLWPLVLIAIGVSLLINHLFR